MPLLKTRPSLAMKISAGLSLIILLGLGSWQVDRLFWKKDLIEMRQAQAQMPPIAVPTDTILDPDMAFRAAYAEGRYLNDQEKYLMARTRRGNVGFQLITPLEQEDGRIILVNRGWVPQDYREPETRPQSLIEGPVRVSGVLRLPSEKHWAQPENDAIRNQWFYVDVNHMAEDTGADLASPYYLELDDTPIPGGLPIGGQAKVELPNNHLEYAITWYSLALTLIVMFVLYHRRPTSDDEKDAQA
ncbi:SURF1 family protein [Thalassospira profundimaris]|uniref:SURF1 family protein n=1 Tax=Thalassospira profundimaris TaxID=502049 RepID=UPI0002871A92|nr:SURF1 family protein [Thalassospira profundimaris]EKF09104.1 SURF1 family protein [Thalassospira profundimaris WP0211]